MHSGNPILAVDCSTREASIALAFDTHIDERRIAHGQQAALLVPEIDALLKKHQVAYASLSFIVATLGPGSFTGLRIALATVHGLSLAHRIPTKAMTSLEAVAWQVAAETGAPATFHVALDAGKGEVFLQEFYHENFIPKAMGDISLVQPHTLNGISRCYGNLPGICQMTPHASTLCRAAPHLPDTPLVAMLPLYIRPPDAKPGSLPPWLHTT